VSTDASPPPTAGSTTAGSTTAGSTTAGSTTAGSATGRLPAGTTARRWGGLGPFVTFVEYERPDGVLARWDSRRHRKHRADGAHEPPGTWWAPHARGWWIGVLFAVGSALFALGAVPGYATGVGVRTDSITYFIGSLFFTSAGFLQYRESVDSGPGGRGRGWGRVFVYRPAQIDWWASGIQLVGTVFFNVSTATAIVADLSAQTAQHHVWRPDALGSICFLVASGMAWFEVCHGWWAWRPGGLSWWITLLNLVGSVAFGVSAVASYVVPSTGQLRNVALCFLAGAVLLLPERTSDGVSP
jgi:hypothetical protein